MSDTHEFGWKADDGPEVHDRTGGCREWAVRLADAAEGLLSEAEQAEVDRHVLTCAGCAEDLADAQRGAAWLALLKGHTPEPPLKLLDAILAKTSGMGPAAANLGAPLEAMPAVAGTAPHAWWVAPTASAGFGRVGLWQRVGRWLGIEGAFASVLQPRLAMTSAMAFLSICLTFNLLGVPVRNLNRSAASLRPGELQRTVADTGASLVRSFEGIRMVYRVESRVNEWRTATATGSETGLSLPW